MFPPFRHKKQKGNMNITEGKKKLNKTPDACIKTAFKMLDPIASK